MDGLNTTSVTKYMKDFTSFLKLIFPSDHSYLKNLVQITISKKKLERSAKHFRAIYTRQNRTRLTSDAC